jgi:hypothetical protein
MSGGWGSVAWGAGPFGGGGGEAPVPGATSIPSSSGAGVDTPDPLGVDIDVLDDLPPTFRLVSGQRNLGNAIARRLSTPSGALALIGGDPEYGFDLRDKMNANWTQAELAALGAQVEAECRKDERVEGATVTAAHDLRTSTLRIDIQLQSAAGPFALVVQVSDVGIEMLQPE